jgi:pimeloyl-ACP methyl ester carboxylesterase
MVRYVVYILIFITLLICVKKSLFEIERTLLFHPIKLDPTFDFDIQYNINKLRKNVSDKVTLKEINIPTSNNNEKVNALYFKNPHTEKHIVYCHGNAGNIYHNIHMIHRLGKYASVILFDYRGFGKSDGTPSEDNIYNDIQSVWNYLVSEKKISPKNIILYGTSLGCAPTSWLASQLCRNKNHHHKSPLAIIMESGFSSLKHVTLDWYPKFLAYLQSQQFNNMAHVKEIKNKIPVIVAHGEEDEIVNIKHMHKLKKCNHHVHAIKLNGRHNDSKLDSNHHYLATIRKYLS